MQTGLILKSSAGVRIEHDCYEYLLAVVPGEDVFDTVMGEKDTFYCEFGGPDTSTVKPQITIGSFEAKEAMEETIIRYMHRICSQQQSFEVALNNYSGFPPHTIYLRVQNQEPFRNLARQLKVVDHYINSCDCPAARFTSVPYLSIASKLPENIYFLALAKYAQKTFHQTFVADELLLLRRSNQYDGYKTVNVFRFQPALK